MPVRRQQGFTLLEVLVAFMLTALLLAVILSGFSTGMSALSRTDKMAQAALIAQSRLAEAGLVEPLLQGEYGGQTEDNQVAFRWQVRLLPFEWEYAASLRAQGLEMYKVEVNVFWPAAVGEHQFQLVSWRMATVREGVE